MGHLCLTKQKQCWPCSHFRVTQQKMGRNRFELFQIRFGQNSFTKQKSWGCKLPTEDLVYPVLSHTCVL